MVEAVFLDLDGTLMDSKPGIEASLRAAFQETGHPDLAAQDLTPLIGPSFSVSFKKLGLTNAPDIIAAYRRHYDNGEGMFNARPYDGVPAMLQSLTEAGYRLYLATAKPHLQACKVTAHFGIAPYMVREFGPEQDGTRDWKGDLLRYAMDETGERPETSVMVGDRAHDVTAAAEVGMPCIAARWGYGGPDEWEGTVAVADVPTDLPGIIAGMAA